MWRWRLLLLAFLLALVLVANPSTGPKSITDMIERSKTTPGGLTYGSTGTNTG